jgi:ketosteroid isomerase-like protein
MNMKQVFLLLLLFFGLEIGALAQGQADVDAVKHVLQQYRATQDMGDIDGQARLMTSDRVWISPSSGRRVDNDENVRIQRAQSDRQKKVVPGLQQFTEDRDVLIKFYGDGKVAIVSFFRYVTVVLPPEASPDLVNAYKGYSQWTTLVLEKRDGKWVIVHTHF